MSKNDIKQYEVARQEFTRHEMITILNFRLSPAFFVRLRESVGQSTKQQKQRGI